MTITQQTWALIVASLFCFATSQDTSCGTPPPTAPAGTCSASVSVQQTQPGHGSFKYNNIYVQNMGTCNITRIFVDVTLPPYTEAFAYYNMDNQTGELMGLPIPMTSASNELGGTIVMTTARIPLVSVARVECDPACSGAPQATRSVRAAIVHPESEPTKIEVQWGANPYWIALHLIGDAGTTKEVIVSDAAGVSQQMKHESWDNKLVFAFSGVQMTLPLSLELTSVENDKITLTNVITAFSHAILDTGLSYMNSRVNNTEGEVKLQVHPASYSNWIGIVAQSTRSVAQMSMKSASNTDDWVSMEQPTPGFFEFSSPKMDIQLPVSVKLTFADDESLVIEDAVVEFQH